MLLKPRHIYLIGIILLVLPPFRCIASDEIGMVTGSPTGTYFRFGSEIAEVAKSKGLNIEVKASKGSLDNISRLDSEENAAFAIVQSDVLRFLKNSRDQSLSKTAGRLRMICPFYNEEVHLFARKEIRRFQDLEGKLVVLGAIGSGNFITATNLFYLMRVKPKEEITNLDPPDAVRAVLTNQADAMFYVAGKPVQVFKNLEKLENETDMANFLKGVHFVPLEDPKMLDEYTASNFGNSDYRWATTTVSTIAVKAVLVSFDFSSRSTPYFRLRCNQLELLSKALNDNIDQLRTRGHPKWKEVNLNERVGTWPLDTCSRRSEIPPENIRDKTQIIQDKLKCTILGKCWKNGECVPCQ